MGANAQTSVPTFTAGDVLTAANMNISARTGVPVFADTTARDAGFGGTGEKTLAEGQTCYLESTNAFQVYDGTNWLNHDNEWTTYTPTWTNLTVGNATQAFAYCQIGKFVAVTGILTWGSTTSATGTFTMSLPITASSTQSSWFGVCNALDSGVENYHGLVLNASTTTVALRVYGVTGSRIKSDPITNTVPFTWGTSDAVSVQLFYRAA